MFQTPLPTDIEAARQWSADDLQPYFDELEQRDLTAETLDEWLRDWSAFNDVMSEVFSRASLATAQNTADTEAEAYLKHIRANLQPYVRRRNHLLERKLVESGLTPENFEIPLRKMESEIALFRLENLPLMVEEQNLTTEYSKIAGAQTVEWDGQELTFSRLMKEMDHGPREKREQVWRLMMQRAQQDRGAINSLWTTIFKLRQQMAANADHENYLSYAWQQRKRFDYTPADAYTFHAAIEEVVIPAAKRILERRQARLGVETLRPWDLSIDPFNRPPLRPYEQIEDFEARAEQIFTHVDPQLGGYYAELRQNGMLDLPNRKNKRPGAFCTRLAMSRSPFVFMNAVGAQGDVRTLLHECGHAFHGFETMRLPYTQQHSYPIEFAEVASMAMELLAAPYLTQEFGGFYNTADYARDRITHLEKIVLFWPYMAVVDAFQLWAYTNGDVAADPAACDAKWLELANRFEGTVDMTGLEEIQATGWQRKQHIFLYPLYYIEYGLAQLGAVQVWSNALKNQAEAVAAYRRGLALGGTRTLPELFSAAGAKFAFDAETLGAAVNLIEATLNQLESQA